MSFTALPAAGTAPAKLLLRQYVAKLKKSAEGTGPYTELLEMGPVT